MGAVHVHIVNQPEWITKRIPSEIRLQTVDSCQRGGTGNSLYFSTVTTHFVFCNTTELRGVGEGARWRSSTCENDLHNASVSVDEKVEWWPSKPERIAAHSLPCHSPAVYIKNNLIVRSDALYAVNVRSDC
jgi:hypothetical protein